MSIASRTQLMRELSEVVGHYVMADQMDEILARISEELGRYSIEPDSEQPGTDSETDDFLRAFLSAKEVEGRSPKTLARYEYICKRVLNKMAAPIREISVYHLRKWLSDEKARGIADSTLDGNREVLSSLFGWLHKEGLIRKNPTANLGTIKVQKKVRKPYSQTDIESCGLDRDDLDFLNKEVTVLGKGNKERTVFLDDVCIMCLTRYLSERKDDNPALFIGKRHERLEPGGVREMLRVLSEKAGVENVHPHRFRRTLATNLIDHGMELQNVSQILGHERLDTTMTYIYTSKGDLKNQYRKYA